MKVFQINVQFFYKLFNKMRFEHCQILLELHQNIRD